MRIGILEYCFGGGLPSVETEFGELLSEGRSMAMALAQDAQEIDNIEFLLAVDQRWIGECKCSVHAIPIDSHRELLPQWQNLAERCDKVIVIAPEIDGVLMQIVQSLRSAGIDLIMPDEEFLVASSNKEETFRHWQRAEIPTPRTVRLDQLSQAPEIIDSLAVESMPFEGYVVKRSDGAGCFGLSRFDSLSSILKETERWPDPYRYIVQPWWIGTPMSVVVLQSSSLRTLLPPCSQRILLKDDGSCRYSGGDVHTMHETRDKLESHVHRWLDALPGEPRGWIGIDFLVVESTDDLFVPIEVNPRLTSSFLGLRQLYGSSIARALFTDLHEEIGEPRSSRISWTL